MQQNDKWFVTAILTWVVRPPLHCFVPQGQFTAAELKTIVHFCNYYVGLANPNSLADRAEFRNSPVGIFVLVKIDLNNSTKCSATEIIILSSS